MTFKLSTQLLLTFAILGAPSVRAQTGLIDQPSDFLVTEEGDKVLRWFGVVGRTYFIQVSDPNYPLASWHWAPVIESGNDEIISYEVDGSGQKGFFRLQYTDQPTNDPDNDDFDGDGVSNINEITNNLLLTNPLDSDTDGDGTGDGQDGAPNNAAVGGLPIRGTYESRWIYARIWDEVFGTGQNLAVTKVFEGTDPGGNSWITAQEEYVELVASENHLELATKSSTFPLPGDWESALRGLAWKNIEELRTTNWPIPQLPYKEWTAGHLEHRLRLNRKAGTDGYEFPLQVLKLNWTRNAAEGSPWVPAAGSSSIIEKFSFAAGETLSEAATYDPITNVAANQAVTLHAIRFEEIEPESGFDDLVRYLPEQRFDIPWLAVANSATPQAKPNAQVKLYFSPVDFPLELTIDVPGPHSATVTPDSASGTSPLTLAIEGSNTFGENENTYEGTLKINGVAALQLAFYKRREVKLAVHEITLINDDLEAEYVKSYGDPAEPIAIGEGKPNAVCIRKGENGIVNSTPGGDDVAPGGGIITTGANGICETTVAVDDEPIIELGKGEPNAVIINPGPNNELNTAPNEPDANTPLPGGGVFGAQDDTVIGTTITTGPDGIRQTPAPKPVQPPVNVPSQASMEEYLDRIFGTQANIWFEISSWNESNAAFDVAAASGIDINYPALSAPNHRFDFFTIEVDSEDIPILSREEQIVQTASKDLTSDFNLYFIPAPLVQRARFEETILGGNEGLPSAGHARSTLRTPYISAFNPASGALQTPAPLLLHAAAHEIAHSSPFQVTGNLPGGLAHPREEKKNPNTGKFEWSPNMPEKNFTLLDLQSDSLRLMWGRYQPVNPSTGRPPGLLLKDEVDKLHTSPGQ